MFDGPTIEPTEEGKPRSITELKWSEALVDPVKTEEILEAIEQAGTELMALKYLIQEDHEFHRMPPLVSRLEVHLTFIKSAMSIMFLTSVVHPRT